MSRRASCSRSDAAAELAATGAKRRAAPAASRRLRDSAARTGDGFGRRSGHLASSARCAAWKQASLGHPGQRTLYHDFHALRARDWSRLLAYVAWELGKDDPAGTDDCVRPQADAYDPSCLDHLSRGAATTATAAAPRGVRSGALRRVRDAAASVGACSALISAAMRSA